MHFTTMFYKSKAQSLIPSCVNNAKANSKHFSIYVTISKVILVLLREVLSYCVTSYARGKPLFHKILKPKMILNFELM